MNILELKWFTGITWDTPVNEIGWMWLLFASCLFALGYVFRAWQEIDL